MAMRRALVLIQRLALAAGLLAAAGGVLAQDLLVALREEIVSVEKPGPADVVLQTTYFRPPGDGPFPWVILNHGKAAGDPHLQPRARYLSAVRELLQRGWAVVVPMRQGFAQSGGVYLNPGCNVHANGLGQAQDVQVVLEAFRRRPELDPRRVLVWGQSHGGLTALAAGTLNLPGVLGLVNFAGGLRQERCPAWEKALAQAFGRYGASTQVPALFFYGDNDSYWPPPVWQEMARRYNAEGGQARVVAFGAFGSDAHGLFGSSAGVRVWLPEVERFVRGLGLPFDKQREIALVEHAEPVDRKSTRLNSSHSQQSRMPSSA